MPHDTPPLPARRRFVIAAAAFTLAGSPFARAEPAPISLSLRALGAEVELRLHGIGTEAAHRHARAAERVLHRVEQAASLYRSDSELRRLNRTGILRHPSAVMGALLSLSHRLNRVTGGMFDPSIQPLFALIARTGGAPSAAELSQARRQSGWHRVTLGADEVRLPPGGALSFNGMAQGLAADLVARTLRRRGMAAALVDTGEIAALGDGPDGTGWPIRIAAATGEPAGTLRLRGRALATSAPLGTVLDPAGRIGHILDPARGPARPLWRLVSVSAPSAAVADGLSTAFCLMDDAAQARALAAFAGARVELRLPA